MKLIVGLGNPGNIYKNTRHNIGFMAIDNYLKENNISYQEKFNGLFVKININNEPVILLKPLSFMNLSGIVVKKFVDYYKINLNDILVIQDDLDMPVGKIKLKSKGSCGGHNGIRNIIDELKSENFARFKIGIGRNKDFTIKNYVLSEFSNSDLDKINQIFSFSNEIINEFVCSGIEKTMSKYNGENYEVK